MDGGSLMQNSTYNPETVKEFEKSKVSLSGQSAYGECTVTDITILTPVNIDLTLVDDFLLTGGTLIVKGGHMEDMVYMQVIHPLYGVVDEFISGFRILADSQKQFELSSPYPAKLPTGLILRVKYVPFAWIGIRDIAINYMLHKILV
jgi:hypothetical protein